MAELGVQASLIEGPVESFLSFFAVVGGFDSDDFDGIVPSINDLLDVVHFCVAPAADQA